MRATGLIKFGIFALLPISVTNNKNKSQGGIKVITCLLFTFTNTSWLYMFIRIFTLNLLLL